jgi:hypothetical protein
VRYGAQTVAGATSGSRLPRKGGTSKKTREALESAAFQIGLVLALERNRQGLNQTELANRVGWSADQNHISRIERGIPSGIAVPTRRDAWRSHRARSYPARPFTAAAAVDVTDSPAVEDAKATYCFCGCGTRVTNPRLIVTNTSQDDG